MGPGQQSVPAFALRREIILKGQTSQFPKKHCRQSGTVPPRKSTDDVIMPLGKKTSIRRLSCRRTHTEASVPLSRSRALTSSQTLQRKRN